jgi:hypothetical protein
LPDPPFRKPQPAEVEAKTKVRRAKVWIFFM